MKGQTKHALQKYNKWPRLLTVGIQEHLKNIHVQKLTYSYTLDQPKPTRQYISCDIQQCTQYSRIYSAIYTVPRVRIAKNKYVRKEY